MKTYLSVILIGLILISGITTTAQPQLKTNTHYHENTISTTTTLQEDDILDQAQTTNNTDVTFGAIETDQQINQTIAQSFIPQTQVLTRIQILLSKDIAAAEPVRLILLQNLTDEPLATVTVLPQDINIYNNYSWIEFDFDDIEIIQNSTYHLILSSTNLTNNIFYCGATATNEYENGTALIRQGQNNGWEIQPTTDLCFKIFGYYLPDMEIGLVGLFGLTVCFTNYGLGDAHDLQYDIIIKGGIYDMIDIDEHGYFGTIPGGGEECVEIPLFGLGWINITAKLNDLIIRRDAIVFFIFVL